MFHGIRFKSAIILIPFFFIILGSCTTGFSDGGQTRLDSLLEMQPAPALTPGEVVGIQLAAFRANDIEDQGIAVAYRFTSPMNKKITGTFENFAQLVKQENFAPMLDNTGFELGPEETQGNTAMVAVRVEIADGNTTSYIFVLSLQKSGAFSGSWMTDGVLRVDSKAASAIQAPVTIDS